MFLLENFEALGTTCWVEVFDDLPAIDSSKISLKLQSTIVEFENTFSRFLPNSTLNQLNKDRYIKNPSEEFLEMLSLSEKYYKLTNGIFDIKIGQILNSRGYGKINYIISDNKNPKIVLKKDLITLEGNFLIDLGGIGKSYLIQKISKMLEQEFKVRYYFINFGGDILATSEKGKAFEVSLENPLNPNTLFGTVSVQNTSVCASSPFKRFWKDQDKKEFNHFVSPNNNFVQNSAFVFAPSVIDADVYATCLCIDPELVMIDPKIGYIILDSNGKIYKTN